MAVYLIRCVDQDVEGRHPYWNSKINRGAGGWVPDRINATTYTQNQRDNLDDREKMHPRGKWERMEVSGAAFEEHLSRCLIQGIRAARKKPCPSTAFFYDEDYVPEKVRDIVDGLKEGTYQPGDIVKSVAKALDLKPTVPALQAFLKSTEENGV